MEHLYRSGSCLREPSLIKLIQAFQAQASPTKIKIKIIVNGKPRWTPDTTTLENVICGSIQYIKMKQMDGPIDVELIGQDEWAVPTLAQLYEQLKQMNASLYDKFMNHS